MSASTTTSLAAWRRRTWTGSPSSTARAVRRPATGRWWGRSTPSPEPWRHRDWASTASRRSFAPISRPSPWFSTGCCAPARRSPPSTPCTRRTRSPSSSPTPARSGCSPSRPCSPQPRKPPPGPGSRPSRLVVLDGAAGHPSLRDLLTAGAPAPDVSFDPATHVAVLPYSSGTTGRPKGVMLSHRNLVANAEQSRGLLKVTPEDRLLALLPFFHIYGLTVLLNLALRQRACLVTMPKFELAEFLRIIQDHRCSYLFIAPPVAVALAKHPMVAEYDLSSVHTDAVRRGAARRRTGQQAGRTPWLPRPAGLRHDRDEPGVPPDSGGRRGPARQLGRLHRSQHGLPAAGSRHRGRY